MAIGKTAPNGTLNADGAFYSVQDVNVLLENAGGGGGDLPTPTVADAGSVVVVDEAGKYALGEAGGGGLVVNMAYNATDDRTELDKSYNEIKTALLNGDNITVLGSVETQQGYSATTYSIRNIKTNTTETEFIVSLYSFIDEEDTLIIDAYEFSSASADGVLAVVN